jgi:hypothetical protein
VGTPTAISDVEKNTAEMRSLFYNHALRTVFKFVESKSTKE